MSSIMAILVVERSKLKRFLVKNQLQSYEIIGFLRIGVTMSCQKLGDILENKVTLKLMLSINTNS